MRQEVTRMHKGWALDNVVLHNEVTKHNFDEIKIPPIVCFYNFYRWYCFLQLDAHCTIIYMYFLQEGVYVHGLYLEGAGWDRRHHRLCESANKVLYVMMPVIHIYALYNTPEKNVKLYNASIYCFVCATQQSLLLNYK